MYSAKLKIFITWPFTEKVLNLVLGNKLLKYLCFCNVLQNVTPCGQESYFLQCYCMESNTWLIYIEY